MTAWAHVETKRVHQTPHLTMRVVVVGVVAARVWWGGERRVHGIDGGLLRWGLRPLSQLGKLAGMGQGGYSPGP